MVLKYTKLNPEMENNIKSKDKPTFESIGNTTIIPTAVIESIKKIN